MTTQQTLGFFGKTATSAFNEARELAKLGDWGTAYGAFKLAGGPDKDKEPITLKHAVICKDIESYKPSGLLNAAQEQFHRAQGTAVREGARELAAVPENGAAAAANGSGIYQNRTGRLHSPNGKYMSIATAAAKGFFNTAKGAITQATSAVKTAAKKAMSGEEVTQAANNAYNAYLNIATQERGIRRHLRSMKKAHDRKKIEAAERELKAVSEALQAAKQAADNAAGEAEKLRIVAGIRRYHGGNHKTRKHRKVRKQTRKH